MKVINCWSIGKAVLCKTGKVNYEVVMKDEKKKKDLPCKYAEKMAPTRC